MLTWGLRHCAYRLGAKSRTGVPKASLSLAKSLIAFLSQDKDFHEELFEGSLFHSTVMVILYLRFIKYVKPGRKIFLK